MNKGKFDKNNALEFAKKYIKDETTLAQIKESNEKCNKGLFFKYVYLQLYI